MNIFSSKVSAHINCLLSTVYLLHNPKQAHPKACCYTTKKNATKQPSQYLRITSIGDVFFAAFSAF